MPHVELSLSEDASRLLGTGRPRPGGAGLAPVGSLDRWATATFGAAEPSLVLDTDAVIVAVSPPCAELIGLGEPEAACGKPLREALGELVDFTASPAQLDNAEADKIPPLLAISSGRLARGLMRVVCPVSGTARTMDAVATPLWDGTTLAGSLTFFSEV